MSETPRQNAQASRLARRQSPYTRVSAPSTPAPSTPSRLRTLLSYVSPFRSARKAAETSASQNDTQPDDERDDAARDPPVEYDERVPNEAQTSSGSASRSVNTPSLLRLNENGNATADLARFFRNKAREGGAPLTPIERAGVLQLLQQGAETQTPTAFTPNFRPEAEPSSVPAPKAAKTAQPTELQPSTTRRRPLYVGAGYTARRRRQARHATTDDADSLAAPAAPAGKRRRVVDDADRPAAGLSFPRASPLSGPTARATVSPAGASRGIAPDATKASTARSDASPKRTTSRAADLMLDIIRSEDSGSTRSSARPAVRPADAARILNPYDTAEDPLAIVSRSPRSSAPSKPPAPAAKQTQLQIEPVKAVQAPEKPAPKPATPIEILQRTMPAEYRREAMKPAMQQRQSSPPRQTTKQVAPPAPKASKPDTIELLSSSDEEEEDVPESEEGDEQEDDETMSDEHEAATEEEDELGAQSDEGDVDSVDMAVDDVEAAGETTRSGTEEAATETEGEPEIVVVDSDGDEDMPVPAAASPAPRPTQNRSQPAFSFGAAAKTTSTAFSFAPTPTPAPASHAGPAPAASMAFAGSAEKGAETTASDTGAPEVLEDPAAAREAALQLAKARLPLSSFDFTAAFPPSQVDLATNSIAEIARSMSRSELPSFAF